MRKNPYASGLQILTSPQALIPFLIGSVALSVIGNSAFQLLTNWLGAGYVGQFIIILLAFLLIWIAVRVLSVIAHRFQPVALRPGKKPPAKRRGLILLVSNDQTPHKAIEWHRETLEYCWFLCSAKSAPDGETLKNQVINIGKNGEIVLIDDVFDPVECRDKVEKIYSELPEGWQETDVILDFTGLTACASVGSVLACLNESRPIQYTPAQYDAKLNALRPIDPVEIVLHWGLIQKLPQPWREELPAQKSIVLSAAETKRQPEPVESAQKLS